MEVPDLQQLSEERLLSNFDKVPDLLGGQGRELDTLDPLHGQHTPATNAQQH